MTRMFLFALIILLVQSTGAPGPTIQPQAKRTPGSPSRSLRIGFIKDETLIGGCGCSFSFPNEMRKKSPRLVFGANIDDVDKGWMNIDGKDIELNHTSSTYTKGPERIADRSTLYFAGPGIKVSADLVATRVCAPDDEQCESSDYIGTFTVTRGRLKQTIRLKGSCGC